VHPIKGLEYLIEAAAALKDLPEVRFRLIGDDRLVPRYTRRLRASIRRAGIADRVEFSGRIDAVEAVAAAYGAADIFVLPSVWDTSPIAVMEAMCFGLPVVATAAGGAGEWVEDGVNGFVVPPADSASLVSAIRRLVEDAALRRRMGEVSARRSLAYRDRTWQEVAREYYHALRPLLSRATS
jgi:glycosyltransferase involved in cell wall biosynthesis